MKNIKLSQIRLSYFKGIKSLEVRFNPNETFIFGANAVGKTTIMDAFLWLLFDKDSTGRKDFQIKTLDENGEAIPQVDHEVEGGLLIDGEETILKKVYSEKWTTRRGSALPVFTGHETTYFIDGVPLRKTDYEKQIEFICNESIFKMITDPHYFSTQLKWEARREILLQIVGDVHDVDVAGENPHYQQVVEALSKYESAEDYKKMLNASIKKQKEELETIPSRIDEVERSKPDPINEKEVKKQLTEKEAELDSIQTQIEDESKAYQAEIDKLKEWQKKQLDAKTAVTDREFEIRQQAKELQQSSPNSKIQNLESQLLLLNTEKSKLETQKSSNESQIAVLKENIKVTDREMVDLRAEWSKVNGETFDSTKDTDCPTCHQHLPENMISDLEESFNKKRKERLDNINVNGKGLKEKKQATEEKIKILETENGKLFTRLLELVKQIDEISDDIKDLSAVQKEVKSFEEIFSALLIADKKYKELSEELVTVENSKPTEIKIDNEELKSKRLTVSMEIQELNKVLSAKEQIAKADERITELKEQQSKLAEEINDVDAKMFLLEEFLKTKNEMVESRVNRKFKLVQFKLFKDQINGGYQNICDATVDGVPFSDLNSAMKINAGIDIINTLTKHYDVSATIWIDNRESVSDIIETDSQVVNLVVSKEDEKLRVAI